MVKKFIIKFNTIDFLPKEIMPKQGSMKRISIENNHSFYEISAKQCRKITLPKKMILDQKDFIAIGLYLAEGTTYINPKRKYKHSGEVAFANSNLHSIKTFCSLLEKFNISRKSLKWKVGLNINYKNQIDKIRLFKYWSEGIGLKCINARPNWLYYSGVKGGRLSSNTGKMGCLHVFYSSVILRNIIVSFVQDNLDYGIRTKSKELLAAVVTGFFAGDGNVDFSERFNRKHVEFSCNNLELLYKIKESLEILGLQSIKETWPETTKTHTKALRIYNSHDFKILGKHGIPNFVDYKKNTFEKIMASI